ncbi:hypothetical protein M407DRAFT_24539 [Tulasnella calospora MUT 4182]|uniref:F-box domain-containing protein n=1 Tax=Tulasnella calospora MUT 4182 TaxID=1051891 RepID=A0A0C3Q8N9_9AGAM|nr:hypothetical protein M407DRAFT_24539 [Tulasnella calospora MUT 4182]
MSIQDLPIELITEVIRLLPWRGIPDAGSACKLWGEIAAKRWHSHAPALSTLLRTLYPKGPHDLSSPLSSAREEFYRLTSTAAVVRLTKSLPAGFNAQRIIAAFSQLFIESPTPFPRTKTVAIYGGHGHVLQFIQLFQPWEIFTLQVLSPSGLGCSAGLIIRLPSTPVECWLIPVPSFPVQL